MSALMDIVFCVDCTPSMGTNSDQIHATIITTYEKILKIKGSLRAGFIKFRSIDDTWNTFAHGYTDDIGTLEQWLNSDESGEGRAVGNALNEALNMQWPNRDRVSKGKVVILFTTGAPNGLRTPLVGADPWIISNRFVEQNSTLVVVGVGQSVLSCAYFYCALAKNTGGQYIPMVNFDRIFSKVIRMIFNEDETVDQAFRRVSIEEIEANSSFQYTLMSENMNAMMRICKTMDDVRTFSLNHHLF